MIHAAIFMCMSLLPAMFISKMGILVLAVFLHFHELTGK